MTYEQAQLYIKLFILQHYDENIKDIFPDIRFSAKVSELECDFEGDWFVRGNAYVFVASRNGLEIYPYIVTGKQIGRAHV